MIPRPTESRLHGNHRYGTQWTVTPERLALEQRLTPEHKATVSRYDLTEFKAVAQRVARARGVAL